mgnify:CR=1 FL=1
MKIYTIGVYGKPEEEFFSSLVNNGITCFFDIRQRRGVRGAKYKFVNSNYLQKKLLDLNIDYKHLKDLAPTSAIREVQKKQDINSNIKKRDRGLLSNEFCCLYQKDILDDYNFSEELLAIERGESIAFFCVEQEHHACHRSLVTKSLSAINPSLEVVHL